MEHHHSSTKKYIPFVACAHETVQIAARLAEEGEKLKNTADSLMRKPHAKDGKPKTKTKLMAPSSFEEEFHGKVVSLKNDLIYHIYLYIKYID